MLKKQFILLLSVFILQLFLAQTIAFLISSLNHSDSIELTNNNERASEFSIIEFNISTHANIWSINKDENGKEESNLEIIAKFIHILNHDILNSHLLEISSYLYKNCFSNIFSLPVYILIRIFRL